MYNPNNNGKVVPPPPAQNYGAVNQTNTYGGGYGNPRPNTYTYAANGATHNTTAYDLPAYDKPTYNGTAGGSNPNNGGLFDEFSLNEFSSTKIRHGFIRKVYCLLTIQLLLTFGFAFAAIYSDTLRMTLLGSYYLFLFLGIGMTLPILIFLACVPSSARSFPMNYILLFIITAGMSFLVGLASATTKSDIFYYALATTAVVTTALTIFSFQTKFDFTGWAVYLYIAFIILFFIGILGIFFRSKIFNLIFAGISAFLLSISIIVDTQMIVGGKHRTYQFSIDDYIFATLAIYMDIVNLFLSLLSLYSAVSE